MQSWACTCVSDAVNILFRNQQGGSAEACKRGVIIVPQIAVVTYCFCPLSEYWHSSFCPHATPPRLLNLVLIDAPTHCRAQEGKAETFREGGAQCTVTITSVREEAAGRVSGLGTRWNDDTLSSGIRDSKETGRSPPLWSNLDGAGVLLLQIRAEGRLR